MANLVKEKQQRMVYIDYLRVFAALSVVTLHIAAKYLFDSDVNGQEWSVLNFFDSIVRWGVPVFVMISGSLFIKRDIPIKILYKKYVLRMAVAFLVWSAIYTIVGSFYGDTAPVMLRGYYHMWFILMLIGVYICIPIINPIVMSKVTTKYFLVLSLIFAIVLPSVFVLVNDFGSGVTLEIINELKDDINTVKPHMVIGYMGYFVLGYYINSIELNKRQRYIIYLLGVFGFVLTVTLEQISAVKNQACNGYYIGNFSVTIFLESVAVFTWFKYRKYNKCKLNGFVQKLSKYSFGAYLVHALIIDLIYREWNIDSRIFDETALGVISASILVFVVSFVVSALLNKIPILNKFMV